MGYSTDFTGELKFAGEMTGPMFAKVKSMLQEDLRDHPEWGPRGDCYYMQFELLKDFSGIEWDGGEKFYGAVDAVNILTRVLRETWPEFGFTGQLNAQGEQFDDRWVLAMEEGIAIKRDVVIVGNRVTCPHCEQEFVIEEN